MENLKLYKDLIPLLTLLGAMSIYVYNLNQRTFLMELEALNTDRFDKFIPCYLIILGILFFNFMFSGVSIEKIILFIILVVIFVINNYKIKKYEKFKKQLYYSSKNYKEILEECPFKNNKFFSVIPLIFFIIFISLFKFNVFSFQKSIADIGFTVLLIMSWGVFIIFVAMIEQEKSFRNFQYFTFRGKGIEKVFNHEKIGAYLIGRTKEYYLIKPDNELVQKLSISEVQAINIGLKKGVIYGEESE